MELQSSFQCQICEKFCQTGKELAHHVAHCQDRWSCVEPSCNVQLIQGYVNLRDHVNNKHKGLKEVLCNMCDIKCKSFGGWGRHASSKHRARVAVVDDHSSSTLDDSGDLDDDESLPSSSSAERATRTENVVLDGVLRQSKRNGAPIFKPRKELEGDEHVIHIEQRILLSAHKEMKDGVTKKFEPGTKASSECKRTQETNMLNKIITDTTGLIKTKYMDGKGKLTAKEKNELNTLQRDATGKLFTLKMESDSIGVSWKVGLKMSAGHLGNEKLGQVGTDTNLIVKTQSCNVKYCKAFEGPLKEFIDGVVKMNLKTDAFVKVEYFVPDYGTLVHVHTNESGERETLEIPFAPEFNVEFSLENNTNPDIQKLFDDKFKNLRPAETKSARVYSVYFSNDYPSKMTLLKDDSLPPEHPISPEITDISESLGAIKL